LELFRLERKGWLGNLWLDKWLSIFDQTIIKMQRKLKKLTTQPSLLSNISKSFTRVN
jgi:hypothetical protein